MVALFFYSIMAKTKATIMWGFSTESGMLVGTYLINKKNFTGTGGKSALPVLKKYDKKLRKRVILKLKDAKH